MKNIRAIMILGLLAVLLFMGSRCMPRSSRERALEATVAALQTQVAQQPQLPRALLPHELQRTPPATGPTSTPAPNREAVVRVIDAYNSAYSKSDAETAFSYLAPAELIKSLYSDVSWERGFCWHFFDSVEELKAAMGKTLSARGSLVNWTVDNIDFIHIPKYGGGFNKANCEVWRTWSDSTVSLYEFDLVPGDGGWLICDIDEESY